MFSVIIPLYNKEISIKSTIQSVLDQTFQDFEIVVIDDGSTDESREVVQRFLDTRIRIFHQKNKGVSAARNLGIKKAKNTWIAFLDGDDLWKEGHLALLNEMIKKYPEDSAFCTSYINDRQEFPLEDDKTIQIVDDYFLEARKRNFFWTSVTCIHKIVFEKVGDFNVLLNRGEDIEFWARVGRYYRIIWSKTVSGLYRENAECRLNTKRSNYYQSILSIISLKGTKANERKYLKKLLLKRLKRDFFAGRYRGVYRIIAKHHFELIT